MRSRGALVGVAVVAALLGGCRADESSAHPLTWHRLDTPGAVRVTALASGSPLLVAGQVGTGDAAQPRLWQLTGNDWLPVPLHPVTYYGARAALVRVAAHGGHLVALGRAVGGAHGNPRFSTWSGPSSGVGETAQAFELFGGPRAIGLNGLAAGADQDVVVGSWAPGTAPAGVTVWTGDGATYQRRDTEAGLRSSASDQTSASAIAARGPGFVVAGTTTHLGGGRITLHATAFWTTARGAPWRRELLPSSGSEGGDSSALGVACAAVVCTVAGVDDGRLAIWRVADDGRAERVDLGRHAPRLSSSDVVVSVAADGDSAWVLAAGQLLRLRDGDVQAFGAPSGTGVALATSGSLLFAVTSNGEMQAATAP
ncbi:hypothetical protein ACPPVT_13585 [Angustibacter sp. McL0619]|uniref:hypothetical protein n=1 Tax=Angustibacter sp. McL0619 TaxID=3415676 RepID=UPI003CEBFA94